MTLKETLQLAWNNRHQIADGFYNTYLSSKPHIQEEAARRKALCESNQCGYYDKEGKPETAAVPGKPACMICHCNIELKTACTYCWCALLDKQIQRLKEIRPDTNTGDIESCRAVIKTLQSHGVDLGPDPLWDMMMTKEQSDVASGIDYANQFKQNQ